MAQCVVCDKKTVIARQISHSGIHTRRLFRPNLHKYLGKMYCTKCLRMVKRKTMLKKESAPKQPASL